MRRLAYILGGALLLAWVALAQNFPTIGQSGSRASGGGGVGSANMNTVVAPLTYSSIGGGGVTNVQIDALCGGGTAGTNIIGVYNLVITTNTYFVSPIHMPTNAVGLATNFWQATVNLIQDGTGNWTVNFDTNYWRFSQGIVPLLQLPANSRSVLSAQNSPYGTNAYAVSSPDFR